MKPIIVFAILLWPVLGIDKDQRRGDLSRFTTCAGCRHLAANTAAIFVGPDGKYVVERLCEQEDIIIADLDLDALDRERMTLDVSGHYNRSDLFAFQVETKG